MPLVQIVVGPLYSRYQDYQTDRRLQGDHVFRHAAQRDLAHAIKAQDTVKAQALIKGAGDLNKIYDSETLLYFAVSNSKEKPDES